MKSTIYDELLSFKDEIEILYNKDGFDVRKLAKKYGTSRWMMQKFMESAGIEIHKPLANKQIVTDEEKLAELYNQCVPISKISEIFGVGRRAINRKVEEMGLTRPKSMMMRREQYDATNDEKIKKLYAEGKSSTEIGKILKISHMAVLSHMKHCGVKSRTLSESQFTYNEKEFPEDLKDYDKVYDLYVVQRLSKKDLSETYNVSTRVIDRILKEFKISIRNCSEAKIGTITGPNHPNWKGGRTSLYMRVREYFYENHEEKTHEFIRGMNPR